MFLQQQSERRAINVPLGIPRGETIHVLGFLVMVYVSVVALALLILLFLCGGKAGKLLHEKNIQHKRRCFAWFK